MTELLPYRLAQNIWFEAPLNQYFMASSSDSIFPDHRCYLLGCECSEVGCWPLEARILIVQTQYEACEYCIFAPNESGTYASVNGDPQMEIHARTPCSQRQRSIHC